MLFCRVFLVLVIAATPSLAEQTSDQSKFEAAKAAYEAETGRIYAVISASIEKRLGAAQKSGQKQVVAALVAEQKAFEDYKDIPPTTPAALQRKLASFTRIMDDAYSDEVKTLTKAGEAEGAKALEKEQQEFRQRVAIQSTRRTLMGTWKLQMGSYKSDFTFFPDGTMFHSTENFRGTWEVDLETRRILVKAPNGGGTDKINLPLDPKGTEGLSSSGGVFKLTKK